MADKKKGSGGPKKGPRRDRKGSKKKRLAKALKKNRRVPPFVMLKTSRNVTFNRYRRNWRTEKLNIQEED